MVVANDVVLVQSPAPIDREVTMAVMARKVAGRVPRADRHELNQRQHREVCRVGEEPGARPAFPLATHARITPSR